MMKLSWMLMLLLGLATSGMAMADTSSEAYATTVEEVEPTGNSAYYPTKWLCEAAPVFTYGYYYWISYNKAYAYQQAFGTCVANHGTCRWACRLVW
jgi:hypothetical protein